MLRILMISFLIASSLFLSGCNTNKTITKTKIEYKYIPSEILVVDCQAIRAGDTVRSLAKGYVNNTKCLQAHQKLIEGLKIYTKPNSLEEF